MASASKHPALILDVLLYPDDGQWLAHCLQLDLVEAGATADEAENNLTGVIQHHVQWAIEDDDMEHLFHPAPADTWKRFFAGTPKGFWEIHLTVSAPRIAPPAVRIQRATLDQKHAA